VVPEFKLLAAAVAGELERSMDAAVPVELE
jgi:hypothetical protein